MGRKNYKIVYIFTGGRKDRLSAIEKKESPEDFFYGALELRRRGFTVDLLEEADFSFTPLGKWGLRLVHEPIRFLFGLDLNAVMRLATRRTIDKLNAYTTIIATNNSDGMALALLKYIGRVKSHVIFLSMCPLFPEDHWLKKWVYKRLFPCVTLGIENNHEIDFLKVQYPQESLRMEYAPFGVDSEFWHKGDSHSDKPYILSMGNDAMRDFETLIRSWKKEYPTLKIITRREFYSDLPENIQVIKGDWRGQYLSDIQIRTYIQESLFVIVPTKENLRASGPSVSMQSMGCERAFIISKTKGLWAPYILNDGINCALVEPHNSRALQDKIEFFLSDAIKRELIAKQGRKTLENYFTIKHMADHIETLLTYETSK